LEIFIDEKLAFEEHIQDKIMSLAMQATSYNQELLDDVPDYVRKPTLEPLRNAWLSIATGILQKM